MRGIIINCFLMFLVLWGFSGFVYGQQGEVLLEDVVAEIDSKLGLERIGRSEVRQIYQRIRLLGRRDRIVRMYRLGLKSSYDRQISLKILDELGGNVEFRLSLLKGWLYGSKDVVEQLEILGFIFELDPKLGSSLVMRAIEGIGEDGQLDERLFGFCRGYGNFIVDAGIGVLKSGVGGVYRDRLYWLIFECGHFLDEGKLAEIRLFLEGKLVGFSLREVSFRILVLRLSGVYKLEGLRSEIECRYKDSVVSTERGFALEALFLLTSSADERFLLCKEGVESGDVEVRRVSLMLLANKLGDECGDGCLSYLREAWNIEVWPDVRLAILGILVSRSYKDWESVARGVLFTEEDRMVIHASVKGIRDWKKGLSCQQLRDFIGRGVSGDDISLVFEDYLRRGGDRGCVEGWVRELDVEDEYSRGVVEKWQRALEYCIINDK